MKFISRRLDTFVFLIFYGLAVGTAIISFKPEWIYGNDYILYVKEYILIHDKYTNITPSRLPGLLWVTTIFISAIFFSFMFGAWFGRNYVNYYWLPPAARISYFFGTMVFFAVSLYLILGRNEAL